MGKMNITNDALLAVFAEMIWDESIRKQKEKELYIEIDEALAKRDQELFYSLTSELIGLHAAN
jgi:uncharacterized protein YpiB (UPF0302 family)